MMSRNIYKCISEDDLLTFKRRKIYSEISDGGFLWAIINDSAKITEWLLKRKPQTPVDYNVNSYDNVGKIVIPLEEAIHHDCVNTARVLLKHGAMYQGTLFDVISVEMAEVLRKYGVNIEELDSKGENILSRDFKHYEALHAYILRWIDDSRKQKTDTNLPS